MNKEVFKDALSRSVEQDTAGAPAGSEHRFSPCFEQKMERLIQKEKRPLWHYTNTFGKRLALALLLLAVCLGGVFTASADAREFFFKMLKVPEDPPGDARTEYRYPFSSSDSVEAVMEQFLQAYAGPEAEYFVQEGSSDWRFIYRDVFTDCAYTAVIDGNELRIINNTGGARLSEVRQRIDSFLETHSAADNAARQEKLRTDFLSKLDGTVEELDIFLFYSTQDGRICDYLRYVARDDVFSYFSDGIMTPVP